MGAPSATRATPSSSWTRAASTSSGSSTPCAAQASGAAAIARADVSAVRSGRVAATHSSEPPGRGS